MPDCMRELDARGLRPAVIAGDGRTSPSSASASACRCCSNQRGGRRAGPGRPAGPVRRFPHDARWSRPTAAGSRCRTWAGTRSIRRKPHPLWEGIADGERFYFVHSYYVEPAMPSLTAAETDYGVAFTCAVARDNIFAVQFHPEKSAPPACACSPISSLEALTLTRRRFPSMPSPRCPGMLLIPAIDLKDGHCVRLKQGDMDDVTVFSEDPAAMARHWLEQGARRLHLVDLNGAFAGKPKNERRSVRSPTSSATTSRSSSAAASATSTRSSATSTTASATSSSARPRSRTPASCTTPAAPSPATSSSASTPRTARWRPTAGRR
jgi:hypothetical protein